MPDALLLPIHLDALRLNGQRAVVGETADFSRLPYTDGVREYNPDTANISEEIISRPFQDRALTLNPGIYLHWAVPDGLTQGSDDGSSRQFPSIPDRWLVSRTVNGSTPQQWMVESNYLYPPGSDQSAEAICFPVPNDDPTQQPYRYMGRTVALSGWTEPDPEGTNASYYHWLTAMGYGDPTFAAFFPNCRSVLGFRDPDGGIATSSDPVEYELFGWYSAASQDPVWQINNTGVADPYGALADQYGWTVSEADQEKTFPQRMACYARLTLTPSEVQNSASQFDSVDIAVGNSGSEALSAYLAQTLNGDAATIENELEAVLLNDQLGSQTLDAGFQLQEARHSKQFTAVSGGAIWSVRPQTQSAVAQAQQEQITLDPALAELLNQLNLAQAAYDQARNEMETLRHQLFSDWYKYMLCMYPPPASRGGYPRVDAVRDFINRADLAPLTQKAYMTGSIQVQQGQNGGWQATTPPGTPSKALAQTLAQAITALQTALDAQNQTLAQLSPPTTLVMNPTVGPRYWQPNEPTLLLVGAAVQATDRHGQDDMWGENGMMLGHVLSLSSFAFESQFDALDAELTALAGNDEPGFFTPDEQPWNPFMLEWEVEVFPTEDGCNLTAFDGTYDPEFVTGNYSLTPDKVDLNLRPDEPGVYTDANIYSGRSLLTPHALEQLTDKLQAFLDNPPEGLAQNVLTDLQNAQAAIAASGFNALAQALSGFNDGLTMHRQTLQFPIADPLGFPDYVNFTTRVAQALGECVRQAPQPLLDFNPIRTGVLKLRRLRLVDTFGQIRSLQFDTVYTPETMTIPGQAGLAALPPRLAQPARLNFRWLAAEALPGAADDDEPEMNAHPAASPICGWMLPNNLDGSLAFYDQDGQALGYLIPTADLNDPDKAQWMAAPDSAASLWDPSQIANPHLNQAVAFIRNIGPSFVTAMLNAVDSAMDSVEPASSAQQEGLTLLMGRPLALARAQVGFELQGRPVIDHSWDQLVADMNETATTTDEQGVVFPVRQTAGVTQVQWPIRLGEYQQLNDSLVGYWIEQDDGNGGISLGDAFFSPQSNEPLSTHIRTHAGGEGLNLTQTIAGPSQTAVMLVDPRGVVHAACGALPVKAISIPPDQYADALRSIEAAFLTAPIVTREDQINLSLPTEPGYGWTWTERAYGAWSEVSLIQPAEAEAGFKAKQVLREGWLKLGPKKTM